MPRTLLATSLLSMALAAPVSAADSYTWNPTQVQVASARFAETAAVQQSAVDGAEKAMQVADQGLQGAEKALAFARGYHGSTDVSKAQGRFDELSGRFEELAGTMQGAVDQWLMATQQAFLDAVSRALFAEAEARGVSKIAQCDPAERGGEPCPGIDVSTSVTQRIDSDPVLAQAVRGLIKVPAGLEAMVLPKDAQPPVAAGPWFDAAVLLDEVEGLKAFEERLDRAADRKLGRAEDELRERLSSSMEPLERAQVIEDVQFRLDSEMKALALLRARAGEVVASRLKSLGTPVAVCPWSPEQWGGCEGDNRTPQVKAALVGDKKLSRLLEKAVTAAELDE